MPVKILIVDDHEVVREGIRTLITRARPQWEVCGEATNARDAIEAAKTSMPDVTVLDITMPGMSGLEAASYIVGFRLSCADVYNARIRTSCRRSFSSGCSWVCSEIASGQGFDPGNRASSRRWYVLWIGLQSSGECARPNVTGWETHRGFILGNLALSFNGRPRSDVGAFIKNPRPLS